MDPEKHGQFLFGISSVRPGRGEYVEEETVLVAGYIRVVVEGPCGTWGGLGTSRGLSDGGLDDGAEVDRGRFGKLPSFGRGCVADSREFVSIGKRLVFDGSAYPKKTLLSNLGSYFPWYFA